MLLALSSFVKSLDLIRNWKSMLHLLSEKNIWNDLEGRSRSSAMAQYDV